jgi:hypothetical protein
VKRKYVIGGLALIATLAIVSSAVGGPSLKSLVKKEVSRQLAGKTGPQGPPGTNGTNGTNGSPAASAFLGSVGTVFNSPIEFAPPVGFATSSNGVPGVFEMGAPNATIVARDLFVTAGTAPGAGASRQFELRLASTASGILGCTMTNAQTTCNSGSATGTIPPGDGVSLRVTDSTSPAPLNTSIEFGWRATTP